MKPFSQKCHGFYSLFLLFFSPLEKRDWTILWGGETLVPRGEEEGLCVWSISDHAGQIHQHVCSIGWVEKYEVQREEWPFSLQAVSGERSNRTRVSAARIQTSHEMAAVALFLTAFFSKVFPSRVGQITLKLGMHWLQLGSWVNLFSLCCSFSSKRFFCLWMPSDQILLSWCTVNIMNILCSMQLFFLSLKGNWLSGRLCYSCPVLFLASTFDICSWELLHLFLRYFIFAVQGCCDCRCSREGRRVGYQWSSFVLEWLDGIRYLLLNMVVWAAEEGSLSASCSICGLS